MFPLLIGIIIAAAVFAAFLWSLYRSVTATGKLRVTYVMLALSTLVVIAAITWNFPTLTVTAGLTCLVTGALATMTEPRWNKLLPLVQVILGGLSIWAGAYIAF